MTFTGRVWKVGDDISTDLIMPGETIGMPPAQRVKHMFQANRPGWAAQVQPGDILVARRNYGTGSGRPAAEIMRDLGLGCLLAETINGLFFRNCVNYAFPALEVAGVHGAFEEGDVAEVEFESARVRNTRTGALLTGAPWPPMLLDILRAGGVIRRLEAEGLLEPEEPARPSAAGGPRL